MDLTAWIKTRVDSWGSMVHMWGCRWREEWVTHFKGEDINSESFWVCILNKNGELAGRFHDQNIHKRFSIDSLFVIHIWTCVRYLSSHMITMEESVYDLGRPHIPFAFVIIGGPDGIRGRGSGLVVSRWEGLLLLRDRRFSSLICHLRCLL
jgi:hypothetical protein